MRILAISYMLPPMLFPQAIQIGRLLYHSKSEILAVSGGEARSAQELDHYPDFDRKVRRLIVPSEARLGGALGLLCTRFCPFYGAIPDPYRRWGAQAYRAVVKSLRQMSFTPDLLVTFGEPMSDHLVGLKLKKDLGIPWVAHFSDPWSDNPFRLLQPISAPVNRWLERKVVEAADACVFTSEETLNLVRTKYRPRVRERMSVLPHAYDPSLFARGRTGNPADGIVFRYIGNFYGFRSPLPLIRGLASLAATEPEVLDDVRVELVGSIPPRMIRERRLRGLPEGLLHLRGTVSYRESIALMETADALLTIDAPAKHSVFFPSKLADYIGAGRRLLGIIPPGAAKRIIEQCGGATIRPTASDAELAEFLKREIETARRSKSGNSNSLPSISADILAQYAADHVAGRFDAICHSAIGTGDGRDLAA